MARLILPVAVYRRPTTVRWWSSTVGVVAGEAPVVIRGGEVVFCVHETVVKLVGKFDLSLGHWREKGEVYRSEGGRQRCLD